ncbi:MAG: redoxin domain-containing protein [Paracoccaceae bacterium]
MKCQGGGRILRLGNAGEGYDWQMIVVYSGKHCPICTRYLREVDAIIEPLNEMRVEVVAVSADSAERLQFRSPKRPLGFSSWLWPNSQADACARPLHFQPSPRQ